MSGFAGEFTTGQTPDRERVERMADALAARGPDATGTWADGQLAVAHRRLAVIDTDSSGAQPMVDYENGATIVLDGAVYNHDDLRGELRREGYSFHSPSDSETVLKAHDHWGPRCVDFFAGEFAYVIYEHYSGRLFLTRDRLGTKPLYLAEIDGTLRFASTLPAMLAGGGVDTALDPVALHQYLAWGAVPAPRTILAGVTKVPPATVMIVTADGRRVNESYWRGEYARHHRFEEWELTDWAGAVLDALQTSVERRMLSDIPVGVLLDGGLESSLIVALLAEGGHTELTTFAPAPGSTANADLVAKRFGTDHRRIELTDDGLLDALDGAIGAMSEPVAAADATALHLVAQDVSRTHRVLQTSAGAQEVFAARPRYPGLLGAEGSGAEAYAAAVFGGPSAEALGERYLLDEDPSRALLDRHYRRLGADGPLDRALRFDIEVVLAEGGLACLDNMTMSAGVEARSPFLDHEIVEILAACPPEIKLADAGRGILRAAAGGLVPDEVIDERSVPTLPVVAGLTLVRESFEDDHGLFSADYVERLLAGPADDVTRARLWQLAVLELWLRRNGL